MQAPTLSKIRHDDGRANGELGSALCCRQAWPEKSAEAVALQGADRADIEESDLEQHQKGDRRVDFLVDGKPHRSAEIEAEEPLDDRQQVTAPSIVLADLGLRHLSLSADLWRAGEARALIEQRFHHRGCVVDRQADPDA